MRYVDNAKLQVKATLNCSNLDLEHYMLTPVIVFDFDHGIKKLKERRNGGNINIFIGHNIFKE